MLLRNCSLPRAPGPRPCAAGSAPSSGRRARTAQLVVVAGAVGASACRRRAPVRPGAEHKAPRLAQPTAKQPSSRSSRRGRSSALQPARCRRVADDGEGVRRQSKRRKPVRTRRLKCAGDISAVRASAGRASSGCAYSRSTSGRGPGRSRRSSSISGASRPCLHFGQALREHDRLGPGTAGQSHRATDAGPFRDAVARLRTGTRTLVGMCGRYVNVASTSDLTEEFDVEETIGDDLPPSWNIAPTDPVRVVVKRHPTSDDAGRAGRSGSCAPCNGDSCRTGRGHAPAAPR